MKLDLKSILKSLKLNESTISMLLGAIVIAVVAVLLINYFKDGNQGKLPAGLQNSTESQKAEPAGQYTVKKGDSLWLIAETQTGSGYNWTTIAEDNKLQNPGYIEEGQKLTISTTESKIKAVVSDTSSEKVNSISGATYEVQNGDSLWKISVRAYGDGYNWVKIASENKLAHPNLIHPGNILVLPR